MRRAGNSLIIYSGPVYEDPKDFRGARAFVWIGLFLVREPSSLRIGFI